MTSKLFGSSCGATALLLVLSLGGAPDAAAQPTFSLDDDPSAPLTGPFVPPHRSAEDPYGVIWTPPGACPGAPLGPSPSLAGAPFLDSDALLPGPVIDVPFGPQLAFLDALSSNHTPVGAASVVLDFSVDRTAFGLGGTAVAAEAATNQHPGDIFRSTALFPAPAGMVGGLPAGGGFAGFAPGAGMCGGGGGGNALLHNQGGPGGLGLVPNVASGVGVGPISCGSHDNVDAYESLRSPLKGAPLVYFSYPAAQTMLWGTPIGSEGDIYDVPPGAGVPGPLPPFATAAAMGLGLCGPDDVDALVVFDAGPQGGPAWGGPGAQPSVDYALFSLAPGSASLGCFPVALSPGDIFFTDFNGSFMVYAAACDIGLNMWDNVDALEALPC